LGEENVLKKHCTAGGLAFWYGGRLVSYGELSTQNYFIIYTAIIIGGQSAGFIFGYSSSTSLFLPLQVLAN
jgi:hypothetical protein